MYDLYFKAQEDKLEKAYYHKPLSLNSNYPVSLLPLALTYPIQFTSPNITNPPPSHQHSYIYTT